MLFNNHANGEQSINQLSDGFKQAVSGIKSEQAFEQHRRTFNHLNNQENSQSSMFEKGISKLFNDLLQPDENRNANEPLKQKQFKKKRKRKQHQSHN